MFPIITPILVRPPEPERCPNCERLEDIAQICKHCKFEYPEEDNDGGGKIYFGIAFIVFLISVFFLRNSFCYGFGECGLLERIAAILTSLIIGIGWPIALPIMGIAFLISLF